MPIISWIKRNKLATLLLFIVAYLVFSSGILSSFLGTSLYRSKIAPQAEYDYGVSEEMTIREALPAMGGGGIFYQEDYTPQPEVEDRLVIETSNMSLLVEDVVTVREKIISYAEENGGYMVSTNTSNPQDAPTATVVIRVSSKNLKAALEYFRSLSVKVVSENLKGRDVTDQFVDIDKRIVLLEKTMARFEQVLDQATEISDITNLNREIIRLQDQIDSYKGQQDALVKKAQLAKITIYLSTDEIALPYAPSETFRPSVIFKLAVRSLIGHLRQLATAAIWLGVYAVFWVPGLIVIWLVRRWWKQRSTPQAQQS